MFDVQVEDRKTEGEGEGKGERTRTRYIGRPVPCDWRTGRRHKTRLMVEKIGWAVGMPDFDQGGLQGLR